MRHKGGEKVSLYSHDEICDTCNYAYKHTECCGHFCKCLIDKAHEVNSRNGSCPYYEGPESEHKEMDDEIE